MPTFSFARTAPLPLDETWRRLTDWPRHADAVPLTRIRVLTPAPTREGTRFVARSGFGPLAVDDVMEVTVWRPPAAGEGGLCRLEKRGRVVLGWAEIEVGPGPGAAPAWSGARSYGSGTCPPRLRRHPRGGVPPHVRPRGEPPARGA